MDRNDLHAVALAANAAANGRWLCAMLMVLNIYVGQPKGALLAVLSVAFGYLADAIRRETSHLIMSSGAIAAATISLLIAILTIHNMG